MLIGVAAAAVPLIIHLSRSRRTKKLRFSTTRFFTDQFLRSYRMSRLKEIFLLVARMCLFGFLALALSQPLFVPKSGSASSRGSRAVVLVVDNSASMGYLEEGKPVFEKARGVASEILNSLKPGDRVAIVLAGRWAPGTDRVLLPLTDDLAEARQILSDLKVASLATDLSGALAVGERLIRGVDVSSKEVYVLSDLQDTGWEDLPSEETAGGSGVAFTFVRIQPAHRDNVAVTAVQHGVSSPTAGVPAAGVPIEIRPSIAFQGDAARTEAKLVIDGAVVATQQVSKPERGIWAKPWFYHTARQPGWHWGYVETGPDALPEDNRRYFSFELMEEMRILAINGAPSQVARLDELAFLRISLTVSVSEDGRSPFRLEEKSPGELSAMTAEEMKAFPLIILANVESFSPTTTAKLEQFVRAGGKLLFFLGDQVSAADYNATLASLPGKEGLLPGELIRVEGDVNGPLDYSIADVDYEHPALSAFTDPRAGKFSNVRLRAYWKVKADSSSVLMKVGKETAAQGGAGFIPDPLLCETTLGEGTVMLFTSTCDRDWTDFPSRPTYLPWIHRLVAYLSKSSQTRQLAFGTGSSIAAPWASDGATPVNVKRFTESVDTAQPVSAVPAKNDPSRWFVNATQHPGIYEFSFGGKRELVAVNLPRDESLLVGLDETVLERFPPGEGDKRAEQIRKGLAKLLPKHPAELVYYVDDPATFNTSDSPSRGGRELWTVVLLVVVFIALAEPWLANRISLLHYGKAKPIATGFGGAAPAPREAVPT
jgi:hypothetical protein